MSEDCQGNPSLKTKANKTSQAKHNRQTPPPPPKHKGEHIYVYYTYIYISFTLAKMYHRLFWFKMKKAKKYINHQLLQSDPLIPQMKGTFYALKRHTAMGTNEVTWIVIVI